MLVPAITSCGRCANCKAGMAAHCHGLVSGSTVPTLLALAREGRIEAEKLGTHHFKFGEIEQACDVFGAADERDALKVVITA